MWWSPAYYELDVARLNDAYSRSLYGAAGELNGSGVRVLWPELMSSAERAAIRVQCTPPESADAPGPRPFYMAQFLQHNALWVHWSGAQLGDGTFPEDTWVEVSHCHYSAAMGEPVSTRTPMWFFAVGGSGVRVNLGRSARLGVLTGHLTRTASASANDPQQYAAHLALVRGDISTAGALLHLDLALYDSVQFPKYHAPTWRGERFTEIVMLRMLSEEDYITAHLPQMRCGPADALRVCRHDDAAVVQQSTLCSGTTGEALRSIYTQSNCPEPEWSNFR